MERLSAGPAGGDAAETAAVPPGTAVGGRPPSQASTSTASPPPVATQLTDTQLLQLSLCSAVASAAAGKATVAANNYALVIKIIFRKCFLLEELVLLALAMGYETRKAAHAASPHVAGDDGRKSSGPGRGAAGSGPHDCPLSAGATHEQLVDPLANMGTLLPPGLGEDDYDEERTYSEQKEQREQHQRHQYVRTPPAARDGASIASTVSSASPTAHDSTPGYDAATARWLACLLAKVHPDALPIATLEKICKVPLTGSPNAAASSPARGGAAARRQVASTTAAASIGNWPSATGVNDSPSMSTVAVLPLLPSLKSSPTPSPPGAASPMPVGGRRDMPTGSPNSNSDAAPSLAAAAPFSTSLSLLFATLLWDVACALWNEGFIEDAHHWLSVMDVRRLWKLYKDLCRGGEAAAFREPPEESVKSGDRACALSWPAVLAESCDADMSPSSRRPSRSSAATESPSGGAGQTNHSSGAQQENVVSSPAVPPPRQGILLSALAQVGGPLPMTDLAACFTDPAEFEVGNVGKDAVAAAAQSRTEERSVGDDAAAMHAETRTAALARFVRRLARRTSALRDLCGLMIACETAEDVFYVMYALSSALVTQQWKYGQQQERQRADEAAAAARGAAATTASATATTTNGGLSELLIIANLLIELFITKRAQQLLLEEGGLDEFASGIATAPSPLAADGRGGSAEDAPRRLSRQQQRRRTDRAIRRACDEVVCAFTNGRCLTLYALESYGIPPPCDGDSNTAEAQLLAPELPYVLVSNLLSSTLNYSTRYLFSKVYHGVMGCRGHAAAERHQEAEMSNPSPSSSPSEAAAAASIPSHPNRTRRATDEEKERRRAWTRPPAAAVTAAAAPQRTPPLHAHASPASASATITASVQSVAGELFGLMRKTAVNWRDLGNFGHAGVALQSCSRDNCNYGCRHHHHDVRPSFSMADAPGGDPLRGREGGGGYAERLAAARREHRAAAGDGGSKERVQLGEATPWSAGSPATVTSNNSSLADARSTTGAYRGRADGDAPSMSLPCRAGRSRGCALKTRGVGAAEMMLPSSSSIAVSLLAEENELTGLADAVNDLYLAPAAPASQEEAPPSPPQSATVVHTAAAHLQSRSPSEAVSLRLLALLYRYPQLHTLEPVTASHVGLVAKELNKALHILQTAMRGRFGDGWWLQWRSRREGETQRYYARALADAQRGGYPLSLPATALPSPPARVAGVAGAAVAPPRTIGMSAVQPDPSLLLVGARPWHASVAHEQGKMNAWGLDARGCNGVPPPSAPPPSSGAHTVLSDLWCTRTLTIPTDEELRKPLQDLRGHFTGTTTSPAASRATAAAATDTTSASAAAMHEDAQAAGMLLDVDWDIPPAYTPDVSLDFSAFTTTSVETQESTRQLVESLQQREQALGDDGDGRDDDYSCDDAAGAPGVSVLSRACRRLLHNELPLLQQYSPWRVIYSTRMHGISLSTLFSNCRREAERQGLSGYAANSVVSTTPSDSKPMLLVLELPSSATLQFSEDDAGVREAWADADTSSSTARPDAPRQTDGGRRRHHCHNKLFVGAFLSDLLRLESRRYYGSQECFVFQLFVPGTVGGEATASGASAASAGPQLRVYRATRSNTQYINCRATSIVIGGGDGGSSIYLDDTLCHGATSACATFASPPLSTWVSTPCEAAGDGADGESDMHRRQKSLCVLNVEVIVMDA
ncbi:TLD domain protein conserved [Leishmania donovani]|uniref:TLD_domain_protein_conserved/GeneDB:LmjF.03.0450 n=1 Tax=Leishmania donovani TaxID=5661 RepID=A0A6J8F6F7_LEIDO|nr:TLD domain protein conserved [Leishmania donovani]VDZ41690.1 TLD_domain_protein_conserved/GeneDB:LmjF.03.0450 [Leishmania donovani]